MIGLLSDAVFANVLLNPDCQVGCWNRSTYIYDVAPPDKMVDDMEDNFKESLVIKREDRIYSVSVNANATKYVIGGRDKKVPSTSFALANIPPAAMHLYLLTR